MFVRLIQDIPLYNNLERYETFKTQAKTDLCRVSTFTIINADITREVVPSGAKRKRQLKRNMMSNTSRYTLCLGYLATVD